MHESYFSNRDLKRILVISVLKVLASQSKRVLILSKIGQSSKLWNSNFDGIPVFYDIPFFTAWNMKRISEVFFSNFQLNRNNHKQAGLSRIKLDIYPRFCNLTKKGYQIIGYKISIHKF